MKHEDYCTLLRNEEDRDILTRPLFDVNMRLFHANESYRQIVRDCANYIRLCAQTKKEGYKKPHGYSGANAAIPFNIIALADGTVMINPHITAGWRPRIMESNCGSLMLEKPIKVKRWGAIAFTYFNMDGVACSGEGFLPTVQHEIDHNQGILITDREVKE